MAYVYTACPVHVSTGSKLRPVSELHALTLAVHSYALLLQYMKSSRAMPSALDWESFPESSPTLLYGETGHNQSWKEVWPISMGWDVWLYVP